MEAKHQARHLADPSPHSASSAYPVSPYRVTFDMNALKISDAPSNCEWDILVCVCVYVIPYNWEFSPPLPPPHPPKLLWDFFIPWMFVLYYWLHRALGDLYHMGKIYSTEYFCNAKVAGLGKILSSEKFSAVHCTVFKFMQPTLIYSREMSIIQP